MQVGKYRIWVDKRYPGLHRPIGFQLTTKGGCLGTTYGEPGRDMYRDFSFWFIYWGLFIRLSWKKL